MLYLIQVKKGLEGPVDDLISILQNGVEVSMPTVVCIENKGKSRS